MRKRFCIALFGSLALFCLLTPDPAAAQADKAPAVAPAGADAAGADAAAPDKGKEERPKPPTFLDVIISSGFLGILIWLGLLASSIIGVALAIDGFIRITESKIAPVELMESVKQSMEAGDLLKALKTCEETPCPLANILATGFNNIREGFEILQDAVGVAADIETERLMQRILYINVVVSVAPMLGLLGTVQGMIMAFAALASMEQGAAQSAILALNISQALWTTAAGIVIAVPCIGAFTMLKNKTTKIILNMEAMTLDMTKGLKDVEVVEE